MTRKSHHVVHVANGGWNVKRGGASRASGHYDTKADAINAGRGISQHQHSELVIHNMNGRISLSNSHGHDPHPPRG